MSIWGESKSDAAQPDDSHAAAGMGRKRHHTPTARIHCDARMIFFFIIAER